MALLIFMALGSRPFEKTWSGFSARAAEIRWTSFPLTRLGDSELAQLRDRVLEVALLSDESIVSVGRGYSGELPLIISEAYSSTTPEIGNLNIKVVSEAALIGSVDEGDPLDCIHRIAGPRFSWGEVRVEVWCKLVLPPDHGDLGSPAQVIVCARDEGGWDCRLGRRRPF